MFEMRTNRGLFVLIVAGIILAAAACTPRAQTQQATQSLAPPFRPTATVKDLMDSVVDPNADFIWESVATTVSAAGIEEKVPRTDDEWKELRRHVVALLEASNLLLLERHVAQSGEKSENPGIELSPEEIEGLIKKDRLAWTDLSLKLHDAVVPSLKAVDAKDPEALLQAGDTIDQACEGCHLRYWYPNDQEALKQYAERLKQ
jgi:hypothetical protein